jgi:predicted nucleic acid-binding protein
MTARCFADTNLFLYAASKDPADAGKKAIARALLETEDIGISVQVMQEFAHNATAKKRLGLKAEETGTILRSLLEYPVLPLTGELVLEAFSLAQRYQIGYWDAAIVAAARKLGCELLFSEDLNPGQDYGGVIARNPFTHA